LDAAPADTVSRHMLLSRYRAADRLWNINANILLADVASTAATAVVIDQYQDWLATRLAIVLATSTLDGVVSLAVFASLHTYANRERGLSDLWRVQVHRWVLSPLHYLVGAGLQFALLTAGVRVGVTVVVAYVSAVAAVRIVHTVYGKRSGLFR
jgi:hypothetical protein